MAVHKGEEMRFFQAIFLGVVLLSNAEGKGGFHIKGPFDLDKDKVNECLILNSTKHSILLLEINSLDVKDTLWSYKFDDGTTIATWSNVSGTYQVKVNTQDGDFKIFGDDPCECVEER